MKRLLAFCLAVLMLFSIWVPAAAQSAEVCHDSVPNYTGSGTLYPIPVARTVSAELPDGLYSYVVDKMRSCTETINVSGFSITPEQLYNLMVDITNGEPELFHLQNDWTYRTDSKHRYVTTFDPVYSMSKSTYDTALDFVRSEAEEVIAQTDSSWSDLEKALYLHDYIIAWYEYDNLLQVSDIYNFLKTGKGVCEAYQLYYMYLLDMVGVTNDYVVSDEMGHIWNCVLIDGSWYNVDLTWDEPTNNHMAETRHDCFLVSDAAMTNHYGGISDKECSSTKYDNYSWSDVSSAIVPLDGKWYTIMDDYICEYHPADGNADKIHALEDRWPSDNEGYVWSDYLSGLSAYRGYLIFITPKSFMAYNPKLDITKVLDEYKGSGYLFDGVVDQKTGRYYVTVGNSRNENGVTVFYQIKDSDLPGTVNWIEYKREDATCINPGLLYYKAEGDSSVTKTEILPALGHTAGGEWYSVTDESGNVTAQYRKCTVCGNECELKAVIPADFAGRFADVAAGDWYEGNVAFAVERGLFGGVSATKFAPNTDMSRAMLVTVLWRLEGGPAPVGANPFSDVPAGTWYSTAVQWAYENGIVGGVGGGRFAPDSTVTREQMATILYRYSVGKGYDITADAGVANFPDTSDVSSYAADGYSWARTMGIIDGMSKGDGKIYLNPKGYATRAQVATMLTRFIVYVCE